jgi:hypothetical protein
MTQPTCAVAIHTFAIPVTIHEAWAIQEFSIETGESYDQIFRKALALYRVAHQAKRKNKFIGIATSPDCLETEFTGICKKEPQWS